MNARLNGGFAMRRWILCVLVWVSFCSFGSGEPEGVPISNWTVPPFTESAGFTSMTDATPPRVFVGVQPCRLVDTRPGSGFPAGFGGPALAPGSPRSFDLDNGPCPGLPLGIDAYSLNVTVVNPSGAGHLVIYPQGGAQPTVSSINYVAGETLANAVIVAAGPGGGVTVVAGVSGTNLLIDINGYFSERPGTATNSLVVETASTSPTISATNLSSSCGGPCGVFAQTSGGNAVTGLALGTGVSYGVYGQVNSVTAGSAAVRALANATSGATYGVFAENNSTGAGSAGVFGRTDGTSGTTYGVLGQNNGIPPNAADAAGVQGFHSTFNHGTNHWAPAGVRGDGKYFGLLGISADIPVQGVRISEQGFVAAVGTLAAPGGSSTTAYGVYAGGDIGATGSKGFVEPHPTDPAKVISYFSLEGPESGTYFRGRGRFQRGLARIAVPEDFRMVTDPEGLTVQITPIGGMATFGVVKVDLDEVVVQASRDLEFSYMVNGVRRTHRDLTPIRPGTEYVPDRVDARMPEYLTDGQKRLLIQNGTYLQDGTVNVETARRLGWDRKWSERAGPAPAPE